MEEGRIDSGNEMEFIPNLNELSSYQGHKIQYLINPIEDINKPLQIWQGTQALFDMLTEVDFNKYLYFIKNDNKK